MQYRVLVVPKGFEPLTCRLEVGCSIQLSYGGNHWSLWQDSNLHLPSITFYGFEDRGDTEALFWCSFWIRTSPTQFNETRLTVLHYGLKSIISVFSCTIEGIEPSFQTNVRYQAAHGIEPCFPPGFRRNRTGITSIVHVKTEFSVFMRTPSTKERTDTFVGLFFCFSDLSSSFL